MLGSTIAASFLYGPFCVIPEIYLPHVLFVAGVSLILPAYDYQVLSFILMWMRETCYTGLTIRVCRFNGYEFGKTCTCILEVFNDRFFYRVMYRPLFWDIIPLSVFFESTVLGIGSSPNLILDWFLDTYDGTNWMGGAFNFSSLYDMLLQEIPVLVTCFCVFHICVGIAWPSLARLRSM